MNNKYLKNVFIPLILLTVIIVIWEYHRSDGDVDIVFSGRMIIVTVTIALL